MKRFIFLLLLGFAVVANAQTTPPINTVQFTLMAEQWSSTDTALVNVSVDAVLNKEGLAKMRTEIMDKLNRIAKAKWHIVTFDRSQDQSGLERLHVEAQARVNEADLTDVNANAKSVRKAGQTYRVGQIKFTPTLTEMEQTKAAVREKVYAQAKAEIANIDARFPNEQYFVRQIRFEPMRVTRAQATMVMAKGVTAAPTPVKVNTKVVEVAQVTLGSMVPDTKK